jgi:uncharacterized membrane protein
MKIANIIFAKPEMLYLIIPLIIIMFFILRKKFIKDEQRLFKTKGKKRLVFVFRILFFITLLLALSIPYTEITENYSNLTTIKILVDNSESMELFETENLLNEIKNIDVPTQIINLEMDDYSNIGSSILNHIEPNSNILLISDGQNNFGTKLSDVSLFASSINSKIYSVDLKNKERELSIEIIGPNKVVSNVENEFIVKLNKVGKINQPVVRIFVNNNLEKEVQYDDEIIFKKSFGKGSHIIRAEVDYNDVFSENNIFYKTINVIEKPKILFVTKKNSPLFTLYNDFYYVDKDNDLKKDLDDYYAVVLNNINADDLTNEDIHKLEEFLKNGNGLFVIGGKDSYDWGGYNTSSISNLLPVGIGKPKKQKDAVSAVVLMDTGHSSIESIKDGISFFDVQKSLLVDLIESMNKRNKVSIIEANFFMSTLSELSELGPKRAYLIDQIALLKPHASTEIYKSVINAHNKLRLIKGSKNIIILTDGILSAPDEAQTLENVRRAGNDGIKTYIIGVGENAREEFLQQIKKNGGGEYFRVDESHKIKLYFGDPNAQDTGDLEVYVYDSNHFITEKTNDLTSIYGYNNVFPKNNARMLLTTSQGDPILTIWNYGLGRVAALSTDDGSLWIPEMLEETNSKTMIKTLNYLIENPERKNDLIIEIPELRQKENAKITVRSKDRPQNLSFYEIEQGLYQSNFYSDNAGIVNILGKNAAVNYKKEYLNIGINKNFKNNIEISGGKFIKTEEIKNNLKSISQVNTTKTKNLSWIFIIISIVIYLFEIILRRILNIMESRRI